MNGKNVSPDLSFKKYSNKPGILEWFHMNDKDHVEKTIKDIKKLGIKELRTGLSWADFHTPEGEKWYDWLIPYLGQHVKILPCILYTPPSIGVEPKTSSPPRDQKMYADFVDLVINKYGEYFDYIELWNEPNNLSEYDFTLDNGWSTFTDMIIKASYWAKHLGKKTVLGGMSPIDPNWLNAVAEKGILEYIDVVGIHGFPNVFDNHWFGWQKEIEKIQEVLSKINSQAKIWITETGFSTWQHDEQHQLREFIHALDAPVERVYWYSLYDLSKRFATVDGFHLDEREYHFGLKKENGFPKLLYRLLEENSPTEIKLNSWMAFPHVSIEQKKKSILVTGGAGFIGTNLAHRLLSEGFPVTVLDNLSRPGTEKNLKWLKSIHRENLNIQIADTRNSFALKEAVEQASHVYHLAAQVAVTSSLIDPSHDHEVNVEGTFNLLEAIRNSIHQPSLIYTSTNKVYGNLKNIPISLDTTRYIPGEAKDLEKGINENQPLDFHSPYGSSKGSADQYVLDYARSYDLNFLVFRMSCIYGPHQFGTEDQGWVAHFINKILNEEKITLFGDGKQVRDILYVEDLVNAFFLAKKYIKDLKGEAFNIGGGPKNAVSLIEVINLVSQIHENKVHYDFENWRTGDQKYYVSDISKFSTRTGWEPNVEYKQGIKKLYNWLADYNKIQKNAGKLVDV